MGSSDDINLNFQVQCETWACGNLREIFIRICVS